MVIGFGRLVLCNDFSAFNIHSKYVWTLALIKRNKSMPVSCVSVLHSYQHKIYGYHIQKSYTDSKLATVTGILLLNICEHLLQSKDFILVGPFNRINQL